MPDQSLCLWPIPKPETYTSPWASCSYQFQLCLREIYHSGHNTFKSIRIKIYKKIHNKPWFCLCQKLFRMVAVKWTDKDIRHNMRKWLTWKKSKVKMEVSHKMNNIDTDSVYFFIPSLFFLLPMYHSITPTSSLSVSHALVSPFLLPWTFPFSFISFLLYQRNSSSSMCQRAGPVKQQEFLLDFLRAQRMSVYE